MVASIGRRICLLALTTGLLATGLPALAQPDWATALRSGGYVLVMRHGATHQDQADTDPLNLANVTKQRQLNDAGRAKAREIGAAMKKLGIPVGQVTTSQYFRAIETGRLLGFGEPQPTADVSEGGQVVTPIENNRRTAALRKLAATAVPGTNVAGGEPQAQHHGRLRQGLVRCPRGRNLDLQARRRRRLPAGRAGAGRRLGEARSIGKRKRSQP